MEATAKKLALPPPFEEALSRLQARRIKVIVYDEMIPARHYAWDGIHFTVEGHSMIAAYLLRQILDTIGRQLPTAEPAARQP